MKEQLPATEEEKHAYHMVKGMVAGIVDLDRVRLNKVQSYCGVLLDDEDHPLCWLHFGPKVMSLTMFYPNKRGGKRERIKTLDDLHQLKERFHNTIRDYETA